MSKIGSLSDREAIWSTHLPYEIDMLRFSHYLLQHAGDNKKMTNSLIECFFIHARSLIDFFGEDKPENSKDAVARQFIQLSYKPFGGNSPRPSSNSPYWKLNKQITHLTYDRIVNDDEKISSKDRYSLRDLIEREIENFRQHIREPYTRYAEHYHSRLADNKWPLPPNAQTTTTAATTTTMFYGPVAIGRCPGPQRR